MNRKIMFILSLVVCLLICAGSAFASNDKEKDKPKFKEYKQGNFTVLSNLPDDIKPTIEGYVINEKGKKKQLKGKAKHELLSKKSDGDYDVYEVKTSIDIMANPSDFYGPYDDDGSDNDYINHIGQHQVLYYSYYRHKTIPGTKFYKMDTTQVYWDRERDNLTIGSGSVGIFFNSAGENFDTGGAFDEVESWTGLTPSWKTSLLTYTITKECPTSWPYVDPDGLGWVSSSARAKVYDPYSYLGWLVTEINLT